MNRIKDVLKEKNISVGEFADMIGVSRQAISKQVSGKLLLETLEKFADVLNIPVWELLVSPSEIGKPGNESYLNGYIEYKNTVYTIKSREDLEKLLKLVE